MHIYKAGQIPIGSPTFCSLDETGGELSLGGAESLSRGNGVSGDCNGLPRAGGGLSLCDGPYPCGETGSGLLGKLGCCSYC